MICGIYAILNIINGKYYIGSALDFTDRWRLHKLDLNRNKHHNRHLQKAWLKYGAHNFIFSVIEYTDLLDEREQYWIKALDATNIEKGYNICLFLRNRTGVKASQETRKKLSESHKGWKHSTETLAKMSIAHKGNKGSLGRTQSIEHRAAISAAKQGHFTSEETKAKIAASNRGQKRSEEARLKMSISARNRRIREAEDKKPLDYTCDMWV